MLSTAGQVNEFASNLREGLIELPVDDRSAELLAENRCALERKYPFQL